MNVLGIETSCDETAAAVVKDGSTALSNIINSQIDIHSLYGGVVPEIAARSHIEVINPVINQALYDAHLTWNDIDAISVTYAPGLVGSLLIGTLAARTLAIVKNKLFFPVNHIEAHLYANFITEMNGKLIRDKIPEFPILALIVSGGHSQIVLADKPGQYQILGQTQDDAVGEAFDKVSKILGLGYPGGPAIAQAAQSGNPLAYSLPLARMDGAYDFSFSGLKTAVLRTIQRKVGVDINFPSHGLSELLNQADKDDLAASFQAAAVKALVDKMGVAYQNYQPKSVVIAGGVAANLYLREQLAKHLPINIDFPPINLCTDNAAMVASLGYFYSRSHSPTSPLLIEVAPVKSIVEIQNF